MSSLPPKSCLASTSVVHFRTVRKLKVFIGGIVGVAALIFVVFEGVKIFKPKVSGINVITSPTSTVYINGEQKGKTPYKATLNPGEIILRLIPDSFETPLEPYDTKLSLVGGVETVVKYDFASSDDKSSGQVISFEKNPGGETSLVVVSLPDFVNVLIDGKDRSTTPFKTSSITPGNHTVSLFAEGYGSVDTDIKATDGYKLTLIVKLPKSDEVKSISEEPSPTQVPKEEKTEVEILPTTVGYLRVRSEPSTLADEVGRVDPGKTYPYVSTDEDTGWYEIEFESGGNDGEAKTGWISNQYAKKIENGTKDLKVSPSVAPQTTITP